MKDLKKVKYLILDMDGCVYHPKYLKTLFAQVSARMTEFIALKLGIDKIKAKEIQSDYFYTHDTSLNGLLINHPDKINAHEFLKFVHTINYDCLEKDVELREELLKLDVKAYCATNGSREHAMNCMKKIGIDDLFEGKVMDIVDFNFKPKPNPESLKLLCDNFQIPTNEETVYVEDICKNLTSETAKNMIKVWFSNDEPINDIDKYKDVVDYKIDNLALFLKKIRLLKEQ
ncbi:MAG: HAD family hydrolase [Candidatus Pelagibacter sp.]